MVISINTSNYEIICSFCMVINSFKKWSGKDLWRRLFQVIFFLLIGTWQRNCFQCHLIFRQEIRPFSIWPIQWAAFDTLLFCVTWIQSLAALLIFSSPSLFICKKGWNLQEAVFINNEMRIFGNRFRLCLH